MITRRKAGLALIILLCAGTRPVPAQNSQFGIRGLGTPGRGEGVRARDGRCVRSVRRVLAAR